MHSDVPDGPSKRVAKSPDSPSNTGDSPSSMDDSPSSAGDWPFSMGALLSRVLAG